MPTAKTLFSGHIDGIGLQRCEFKFSFKGKKEAKKEAVKDHVQAVMKALQSLKDHKIIKSYNEIKAIGHRVVHGGEYYKQPTIIDDLVIKNIKKLSELAPLHNPPNLAGIMACEKILPNTPQVAVFDTAFHQTIPKTNFLYGLPYELYVKFGIRKYGFHGISHKYVFEQAEKLLNKKNNEIITCHMGNGSSITAIKNGESINTTMGFTPLEGVFMGTRSGDLDPGIPLFLIKNKHYTAQELDTVLNKQSGLKGITGGVSDVRDLRKMEEEGNEKAKLALDMLSKKVAFYIAGYAASLKKLDAIVFTAGIGENAWFVRNRILDSLKFLGVDYDEDKNKRNEIIISKNNSKVQIFVIPTNEELEIAKETSFLV